MSGKYQNTINREELTLEKAIVKAMSSSTSSKLYEFGPEGIALGQVRAQEWVSQSRGCVLCGRRQFKFLYEKNGYPLVRCEGCGLVSTGLLAQQEAIPSATAPDFTALYEDRYPQAIFWQERPRKLAKAQAEAQLLANLLNANRLSHPRLLDIGCSYGFFLEVARERGWEAEGVELSPVASQWATTQSGLKVFNGSLLASHFPDNSFDVITIRHVLEHIPEIEETLAEVGRILKPGGLFLVAVPNLASLNYRLNGRDWWWIDPPTHWWYFTNRTLTALLGKFGFQTIHYSTHRADDQTVFHATVFGLNHKLKLMPQLRRLKARLSSSSALPPLVTSTNPTERADHPLWQKIVAIGEFIHRRLPWPGRLVAYFGMGGEVLVICRYNK